MAALASHSCIGSPCQQQQLPKGSRATSSGYGVRVAVVSSHSSSPSSSLHSSFSGQQTKHCLKRSSQLNRRKQRGGNSPCEQLRFVATAVDAAVAPSSSSSASASPVLGLEVVETLQPNSRVSISRSPDVPEQMTAIRLLKFISVYSELQHYFGNFQRQTVSQSVCCFVWSFSQFSGRFGMLLKLKFSLFSCQMVRYWFNIY